MNRKFTSFVLFAIACSAFGQEPSWLKRVTVRESLDTKKVPQPAFLTLLFPSGAPRSYTAGIGMRVDAAPDAVSDKLQLGPFLEWAKNTESKKEQDNLRFGASADWTVGDLTVVQWTPVVLAKLNYARDNVKHTSGEQANVYVTPLFRGHALDARKWYIPNTESLIGGAIFFYSPYLGVEDDNTTRAATSSLERNTVRAYSRIVVALRPAAPPLKDRVEFSSDLTYRRDLNAIAGADKGHRLLQHALNLYFFRDPDSDRAAGVGLAYVTGEDPTKGFQQQKLIRLSFILRL